MKRFGFFKNTIKGSEPLNAAGLPEVSITPVLANVNLGNVINFNISANRTTQPTFYWTLQGNVTTGDFVDSEGLSGNIQLDATGNATVTKELYQIGNANVDFYMDIRTGSPATPIEATSTTVFTEDVETMTVTGGDQIITVEEFYTAHRYNTSANLNIIDLGDSANFYSTLANVEYLAAGGGGGGGFVDLNTIPTGKNELASAGGGGAGEVKESSNIVSLANYTVTVGTGGSGGKSNTNALPNNGANTTIFNTVAQGGSIGGSVITNANGEIATGDLDKLNGGNGVIGGGSAGHILANINFTGANITIGSAGVGTINDGGLAVSKTFGSGSLFGKSYLIGAGSGASMTANGRPATTTDLKFGESPDTPANGGGRGAEGYTTNILGNTYKLAYGGGGGAGPIGFSTSQSTIYGVGGIDIDADGSTQSVGGVGAGDYNNGTIFNRGSYPPGTAFNNWPQNPIIGRKGQDGTGSGGGGGAPLLNSYTALSLDGTEGGNGTVIVKYISSFRKATI